MGIFISDSTGEWAKIPQLNLYNQTKYTNHPNLNAGEGEGI